MLVLKALSESEMQGFLRLHGESARPYVDQVLRLGYLFIFPEPDISEETKTVLQDLIRSRYGASNYVADVKFFRKHRNSAFQKDFVRRAEIESLFEFSKSFYPIEMQRLNLGECWDELDIYRQAETFRQKDLKSWLEANLLGDPKNRIQQQKLGVFLRDMLPHLGEKIFKYCTVDSGNENCDFAPYFFIGNTRIIMIARKWEL